MSHNFTEIFKAIRYPSRGETQHYFALVTYAPPEVSEAVDDIRRRYDPAFKDDIAPHITIKRPAILNEPELLSGMSAAVKQAMQNIRPFQVDLEGYNIFRKTDNNVVFLKVRDENPFCQLHMQMIEALETVLPGAGLDQYEGIAFHPHLTIGNALGDLELAVMEYELGSGNYRLNFSFELTEIAMLSQPPGQPWQTIDTFSFGLK